MIGIEYKLCYDKAILRLTCNKEIFYEKVWNKTRNTIAITLILTFAFMFVPIQHMIHAEENPQSTQETQNKGYLDSYTEMYGWEQVEY